MWIMNTDGFFSVVKDDFCKRGQLVVRARRRGDLESLIKSAMDFGIIKSKVKIHKFDEADYLYRIYLNRTIFAEYLSMSGMFIDYPNFKATLQKGDIDRHKAYYGCWRELLKLERGD